EAGRILKILLCDVDGADQALGDRACISAYVDHADHDPGAVIHQRDRVIELKRKGWSVSEIARTLKIAEGMVDLILELGNGNPDQSMDDDDDLSSRRRRW
ncbi:MAG: hypothetical protein ILP18_04250, partial [Treponema sp.]|nr:hypothetical protein [Treponema sp.]